MAEAHQPDPAHPGTMHAPPSGVATPPAPRWSPGDWVWFIIKNLIGWLLILSAGPIGVLLPGPGGLPLFLIGFGLITFPGKRKLTARVMRGIPLNPQSPAYRFGVALFAILAPAAALSYLGYLLGKKGWFSIFLDRGLISTIAVALYLASAVVIFGFGVRGVHLINLVMRGIPRLRRRVRPWLRKHGLDLLPPRRRGRLRNPHAPGAGVPNDEILEIHHRHRERLRVCWQCSRPWAIRLLRLVVVVAMFAWMLKPVYQKWDIVKDRLEDVSWWHFALAALTFSVFLFVFRATVWRWIMAAFGHRLPVPAAARIWSFSELARYLPGVIWQVVGRVYLCKPYGVRGSLSSASQLLELALFMLANIFVAVACLSLAGLRVIPADQRIWLYIAIGFVPLLLLLVHPRIFYGLLNGVMRKLKKEPIEARLQKRFLAGIFCWYILGLLWQSLAVWILTSSIIPLPIQKWWVLAGSYCLAWTIGFSVGFLSPGGIGVREFVFITTVQLFLPSYAIRPEMRDPAILTAFLGFVGVLLRVWAITGELILAGITYIADFKGATNHPDAPGRVKLTRIPPDSASDGGHVETLLQTGKA